MLEGHEYDVELDIDAVLKLGENAIIGLGIKPSLMMVGTKVEIVGIIESIDNDGMVYFRLAPDCIMMIESIGSTLHVTEAICLILVLQRGIRDFGSKMVVSETEHKDLWSKPRCSARRYHH